MRFDLISVGELKRLSGRTDIVLVDLRSEEEYRKGHIEQSIHYSLEELLRDWPLERKNYYIFICNHGNTSVMVARQYAKRGYRCGTLVGGYHSFWEKSL